MCCVKTVTAPSTQWSPLILNFQVHPPVKWTFVMDTIVFSLFASALWLNDQNWASSLIFLIVLLLPTRKIFFVKFLLFASELWTNCLSSIIQIGDVSAIITKWQFELCKLYYVGAFFRPILVFLAIPYHSSFRLVVRWWSLNILCSGLIWLESDQKRNWIKQGAQISFFTVLYFFPV